MTDGASIAVNDGDGRKNRFGVADHGNSADRILFATKPLEVLKRPSRRDLTLDKGFFVILAYDRLVTNDPMAYADDLHNIIAAVRLREPKLGHARDFEAQAFYAYRFSSEYTTEVSAFGGRLTSRLGDFELGAETTLVLGSTTEVSDALAVINNASPVSQEVKAAGARAVVRWDKPLGSVYFETDYASGNGNPSQSAPLTPDATSFAKGVSAIPKCSGRCAESVYAFCIVSSSAFAWASETPGLSRAIAL